MFVDAVGGFRLQTNADGVGKATIAYNSNGTINLASSTQPDATHGYVDFRRTTDSASSNLRNTGSYGNGTVGAGGQVSAAVVHRRPSLAQSNRHGWKPGYTAL